MEGTDSVKVERALVEKNEALVAADALKNTFIHDVSYELRSPLTNIMGFAQLLGDARWGPSAFVELFGSVGAGAGALSFVEARLAGRTLLPGA